MSLFRRPKKANVQRRVFSAIDEDENNDNSDGGNENAADSGDGIKTPPPPALSDKHDKKPKSVTSSSGKSSSKQKPSLLSFGDEEDDEGEVFQVKKSSHSKKVMRMMDKERRKKKHRDHDGGAAADAQEPRSNSNNNGCGRQPSGERDGAASAACVKGVGNDDCADVKRQKSSNATNSSVHTEIRTDDFVLVVKKSETDPNAILNGRAALCAGRDDMSSEEDGDPDSHHRFRRPSNFQTMLESGAIPDAAMIHEARKKRQKARELGDFVAIDEPKVDNKKGRLVREDAEDDGSDEERVDMSAITGAKEREERREKFYAAEHHDSAGESDPDINEWENQQIRKAISGSQLMTAHQEAYSHFVMKEGLNDDLMTGVVSTGALLEKAYATESTKMHKVVNKIHKITKRKEKKAGPRTPKQIYDSIAERLAEVKQLNETHRSEIDQICADLNVIQLEAGECETNGPNAAAKYRFYQELRGYVVDLIECFDEKLPRIVELERRFFVVIVKHANFLIERRRQDVRDQANEMAQAQKPANAANTMSAAARKEEEQRVQRTAEREGRRTRRRRDRERQDIRNGHMDGMSSDDEIPEHELTAHKNQLKQISAESKLIFEDVTEEFCELEAILSHFEAWRDRDMGSYRDSYFSLCLPKIIGPILRLQLITWSPIEDNSKDLERADWYETIMRYGMNASESERTLADDPDIRLIPVLVEKVIVPKITEFVQRVWDPVSSKQTLALVNLMRRLIRDYPSMKPKSKFVRTLFTAVVDKMKDSIDNDVFIPIFPKQLQEAKSSFFQRQFSSALKLLRNLLSWEGILSDSALKDIAISSLLNRYLLSAIRICAPVDGATKAHIIVNTLPRVWLQQPAIIDSLKLFIEYLKTLFAQLDRNNPLHSDALDKMTKIFATFHLSQPLPT